MTIILIFLLLAIAGISLLLGVWRRNEQSRLLRERLTALQQAYERNPSAELSLLREQLVSNIPSLNELLAKTKAVPRLQSWIHQAGLQLLVGKLLLVSACLGGAFGLLFLHLSDLFYLGMVGFALGAGLPWFYVSSARQRRFDRLQALLPDVMGLLSRAVRSGHSFSSCLELIVKEMPEPASSEFGKVYEEQRFGLPLNEALLNLTERVPLSDVRIMVAAVVLQRETGGNLAEVLDNLARLIRERFTIQRQVRVLTAHGRMSMWILMAMPFICALLLSFMAPDMFRLLYTDPLGKAMVATGIVMLTIGYLFIRKIIRIRV